MRKTTAVVLFVLLAVAFVVGTPIELAAKNVDLVEAGLQSSFPIYSARAPYIALFLYALISGKVFLRSLAYKVRHTGLLFAVFASLVFSMIVSMFFTYESDRDLQDIAVDILKYLAFVLLMPLLLADVKNSRLINRLSPSFLFVAAIVAIYSLLSQSATSEIASDGRLRFGLVTTFAAKHVIGILVLAIIEALRLGKSALVTLITFATCATCAVAVYLTGTRGAWIFIAVVIAILAGPSLSRRPKLTLAASACIGLLGLLLVFGQSYFFEAAESVLARFRRRDLFTNRIELWTGYIEHFENNLKHVLFGIPREHPVRESIGRPPHNWFLGVTAQHGMVSTLLLSLFNVLTCGLLLGSGTSRNPQLKWLACAVVVGCFVWSMVENTIFLNAGLLAFILYSILGVSWEYKSKHLGSQLEASESN